MSAAAVQMIETGYKPRAWARKAHALIAMFRFCVLVVHRRGGKTVACVNTLIDAAIRFEGGDGRYGYIAPFLKQAKQVAWDYCKRYTANIPGVRINEAELFIELPNGSRITLYGADNPEAMRGLYFDGLVLDEVAQMKSMVWREILRPTLADRLGWAVFIGTPRGVNVFLELYQHALKAPGWGHIKLDVYDTGVLSQKELDDARSVMSDAQFRQEFLCDFGASSDNVLITIDIATDAMNRKVPSAAYLDGLPKVMGVDVARFGDDRSVIQKRWGHFAFKPLKYSDMDNMQLVGRVGQEINLFKPDVVFIDGGRGEGVIDRLRQLGHENVIEVPFGGKAANAHYINRRTEMYDRMREWLISGGVVPDDPDMKRDLCVATYSYDAQNRMKLERKEDIRKRGMPSPDCADALALTFAEIVVARQFEQTGMVDGYGTMKSDYDVFAEA